MERQNGESKRRYSRRNLADLSLQNLYIASYVHHIEGMREEDSKELIKGLMAHVSQPKYRVTIPWESEKDMIIWYGSRSKQ